MEKEKHLPDNEVGQGKDRFGTNQKILVMVVLAIILGLLVWYFLIRDSSPASVNSQAANQARDEALAEVETSVVESLDGLWVIDTEVGVFNNECLTQACGASFVGFRIDEELLGIGGKTVVGRTPGIEAQFAIEGTRILSSDDPNSKSEIPFVIVDMTQLITDDAARNNAIKKQAIQTDKYPESTFYLTRSIDFGLETNLESGFEIEAIGDLTIHGVTRQESILLQASFDGNRILVYGELSPIKLADYGIEKPRAAVVISVDDEASMEFQLYFKKVS